MAIRDVRCKHCSCNRSFSSEGAMLQHFAASHTSTTTSGDRLQCPKCGRSFDSKPALEQHCRDTSHDLHGIAAMPVSSLALIINRHGIAAMQMLALIIRYGIAAIQTLALVILYGIAAMQTLALIIRHRLADVGTNDLSHRLMAAMTLISGGSTHDGVGGTHDRKDPINSKEIMLTTMKVSCDDCGESFNSFDALHQHRWDKPSHTRVSRWRTPVHGSNVRECSQCVGVFNGGDQLEQHFIRAHPLTEITSNTGDERSTDTWIHVAEKFKLAWKRPMESPVVQYIFKVNNMGWRRRKSEEYRADLKKQMPKICKQLEEEEEGADLDVRRRVLQDGNELQRYHGTTVMCDLLGRLQSTDHRDDDLLCSIEGCGLCGILEGGFRTAKCRVSRFQRFGRGIYVSATCSKAHDYVRMNAGNHQQLRVMLATKVLAGRIYRSTHNLTQLSKPPPGFHSVEGVPGPVLNYDELVVYDDRAILPNYIIFYSVNHMGAPRG